MNFRDILIGPLALPPIKKINVYGRGRGSSRRGLGSSGHVDMYERCVVSMFWVCFVTTCLISRWGQRAELVSWKGLGNKGDRIFVLIFQKLIISQPRSKYFVLLVVDCHSIHCSVIYLYCINISFQMGKKIFF